MDRYDFKIRCTRLSVFALVCVIAIAVYNLIPADMLAAGGDYLRRMVAR